MKKVLWLMIIFLLPVFMMTASAQDGDLLKVCLVSGSAEYNSDECLEMYKTYLEERFPIQCVLLRAVGFEDLPGLGALEDCDVAVFFTRRLTIPEEQLNKIKDYVLAGKPIVAIRTASHGFQDWLEFDKLILGGNYDGHYGNKWAQKARVNEEHQDHPILNGIREIKSLNSLYKTAPLADDCTVLMNSSIPEHESHPSVWTREVNGGRVLYVGIGGPSDFENDTYLRLLTQGLYWTIERDMPEWPEPVVKERPKAEGNLIIPVRSRVKAYAGKEVLKEIGFIENLPADKTAIIVCDMWDKHWCDGATHRVGEMAPQMAAVLQAAQSKNILIAHCPSDTLTFYADHPARHRAMMAPSVEPEINLDIPDKPLPIDDSDGGCDTDNDVQYDPWSRQHEMLPISEFDIISQDGREVYNIFAQEGIENVIIMGVHTNMCVLGRSFAIRQMSRWGKKCILVRDLTDTMYDSNDEPYVSHDRGTELVVKHIEQHWAPTTTSDQLIKAIERID